MAIDPSIRSSSMCCVASAPVFLYVVSVSNIGRCTDRHAQKRRTSSQSKRFVLRVYCLPSKVIWVVVVFPPLSLPEPLSDSDMLEGTLAIQSIGMRQRVMDETKKKGRPGDRAGACTRLKI